jgi:uncharacterized Zn finger protein (UPF0148 family)
VLFDRLLREIRKLDGSKISIDLPLDEQGYLDRQCPSSECQFGFKVLHEDWRDKVSDDRVYCPLCRYEQPSDEWSTTEQVEYAKAAALALVKKNIHVALREDAHQFNRRQKPGFIQMSMNVKSGSPSAILPVGVAGVMQQRLACEACGCQYAVIGAAFFCPACGYNSVVATFDQTIETVRQIVGQMSSVRSLLAANFNEDIAHNSVRTTLEDSIARLVSAFQQYSEVLFDTVPGASTIKRRKNVFQNLAESSTLWRNATGKGYDDLLSTAELRELGELFQNGIVDQEYIDKSGDATYAIGQRVVIKEATVLRLADLLARLSEGLRKLV